MCPTPPRASLRGDRLAAWRLARRHPRVYGLSAGFQVRAADSCCRRPRDKRCTGRKAGRNAGRILRPAVDARARSGADADRLPPCPRRADAGVYARHPLPPRRGRPASIHRVRRGHRPTEFAPGKVFGSGDIPPIDYMVELAEGRIQPPSNLDLPTVQQQELAMSFRFHIRQISAAAPPTGRHRASASR